MGTYIVRTDGSVAFYVLVENFTSTNFNLFAGDLLETALPLDNAIQQIQEWENSDWNETHFGNPQVWNGRRLLRYARAGDPMGIGSFVVP